MKKVLSLFIIFCFCIVAYTQKVYFIYLQSDNGTPFFVKMSDKVYSSTASGYVILSKLIDSTYTFSIGFPGNQTTETSFSVNINKNDKGYLIKNSGSNLVLFDLQSQQINKPISSAETQSQSGTSKADNFTQLLSKAADDPSLLFTPIPVKQEAVVKQEPPPTPQKKEPAEEVKTAKQDTTTSAPVQTAMEKATAPEIKKEQNINNDAALAKSKPVETAATSNVDTIAAKETPYKRSVVTKRSESSTTEGFGLVFLDNTNQGIDTIRLVIPNSKMIIVNDDVQKVTSNPSSEVSTNAKQQTASATVTKAKKNTCRSLASENDFFKLRKAMASKLREQAMISEAMWQFRKRCFTTEQIKNLSTLFLTPAGKYQFFDVAYPHVSDQENYKNLQAEIKDDYYVNRFQTLLSNQ